MSTAVAVVQRVGRPLLVPVLALVSALAVGGIVIVFSDPDTLDAWGRFTSAPGDALQSSWDVVSSSYRALFDSSLGSQRALSRTLLEATPLLFAGLSVALAFRAGLFNIGGSGQLMMGATTAGYVGFTWDLPAALHLPLAIAAGLVGGAVWGGITGLLKARTGAHEVITAIMLNFVALRLLDYALSTEAFRRTGRSDPISPPVAPSARLPVLDIGDLRIGAGLVLGLGAAAGTWWLLQRSTLGFRMRAVGANPSAARYAGMHVGATYIVAMGIAGALAGMAGTANILGTGSYSLTGGYFRFIGFDAIALALLGRSHPGGVVGAALLFGVLRAGSTGMQAETQTPVDIIVVIQALVIAFVAAPALVRAIYRIRARAIGEGQQFTTSWGTG